VNAIELPTLSTKTTETKIREFNQKVKRLIEERRKARRNIGMTTIKLTGGIQQNKWKSH